MKNYENWPKDYVQEESKYCVKETQIFMDDNTPENARLVLSKRQEFARNYIGILEDKLFKIKQILET